MIVDVEMSLLTSFILNFFILTLSALSLRLPCKHKVIASLGASVVSLICPLFKLSKLANFFVVILLALSMCLMCFCYRSFKNFAIECATIFGYTFMFGGGCYLLSSNFGQLPLLSILSAASIIYIICYFVLKHQNKVKRLSQFSYKVTLFLGDKMVEEEGFLDSGNILVDPQTNKPIILVNFEIFSKLYSDVNFVSAYCKNVDLKKVNGGHYVKISTVASGTSILVFTASKVEIADGEDKRDFIDVPVGLSFSGFDKALGKKILLNREFA